MTTAEALDHLRAQVEEVRREHTCCEMFPEHFALHDKPCPMPLFAAALKLAVEALGRVAESHWTIDALIAADAVVACAQALKGEQP